MRKKYLRLTKEQKARGVFFSSVLVPRPGYGLDMQVHEIMHGESGADEKMRRLLDDKFFNGGPYLYNLVRR